MMTALELQDLAREKKWVAVPAKELLDTLDKALTIARDLEKGSTIGGDQPTRLSLMITSLLEKM
jgi:hypothetical protein